MHDAITTVSLVVLTLLSLAASALALRRLVARSDSRAATGIEQGLLLVCSVSTLALFLYSGVIRHASWQPLEAHVDGLLLIAFLLAGTLLFLQYRPRLGGIDAFGLPLLTLLLAWAVCASAWTYRPFNIDNLHPVWMTFHLAGVYLGTLSSALAAVTGGAYLYVRQRLKHKQGLADMGRLANLESLETLIIRAATIGFALLTLGLVTGLIIQTASPSTRLGAGWWHSPKVLLAVTAWAVYAVVMNVRFASSFRGARAAWLSIFGLALLLATYGVVNALPGPSNATAQPAPTQEGQP